jgi:regulator of RNase E activity RraA
MGTYTDADFCIADVLDFAEPGDVLVFDNAGLEISTWGGLASTAAKIKGIEGTIIDGACRDVSQTIEIGYPVFSRHITPRTGKTRLKMVELNAPVQCGGVRVNPGDIVVADQTGVVVVPAPEAQGILDKALANEKREKEFFEQLMKGKSFKEMQQKTGRV